MSESRTQERGHFSIFSCWNPQNHGEASIIDAVGLTLNKANAIQLKWASTKGLSNYSYSIYSSVVCINFFNTISHTIIMRHNKGMSFFDAISMQSAGWFTDVATAFVPQHNHCFMHQTVRGWLKQLVRQNCGLLSLKN